MKTRTLLLALAAAAPLSLAAAPASAWAPLDPSYPVWGSMPVNFKINQATIPSSLSAIAIARIDSSYAQWETAGGQGCTFFDVNNQGDTTSSNNYQDGKNVVRWISSGWSNSYGDVNSVIGFTLPVWNGANHFTDGDIVFNAVGFCWNDTGNSNCVDVKSIATHEQGHFLGLDHTNSNGATMEPYYPGGQSQATIAQDDINGVCALYPIGGSTVGSGGTTSTSSGGATDCQTCSDNSSFNGCSGAYDACVNTQDCLDFYDCYANCSTQSCVDACVNAHPTGTQLYIDLIDCICSDCSVECSAECGGGSSSSSTTSGSTNSSSNAAATTATTGGGETTGVGGAGGAGATAGVGGGDSSAATTGGGTKKKPSQNNVQEVSGCSMGHSSTGATALLFVAALGAAAGRRRRSKKG